MKTTYFIFNVVFGAVILCGCSYQENNPQLEESNPSAKEIVDSNSYISLPEYIMEIKDYYGSKTPFDNKLRAALYRLYPHIKLEDGKYSCDLKSGEEINIAPDLFDKLIEEKCYKCQSLD